MDYQHLLSKLTLIAESILLTIFSFSKNVELKVHYWQKNSVLLQTKLLSVVAIFQNSVIVTFDRFPHVSIHSSWVRKDLAVEL